MFKSVQIIPQRVEGLNYKGPGATKEFFFDGQSYRLSGNQIKSVPYQVADNWVAHDSEVRIVNDR